MPQTYDGFSGFYDAALKPLEQIYLGDLRKEVMGHLPADSNILEVGSGTGANFKYYPDPARVVASDISFGMIQLALTKTDRINIIQADVQALPFPENHFDAVFATLVFCSVPKPADGFSEVFRVLRPGGTLLLIEHVRPEGILGHVFDAVSMVTTAVFDDHFNRRTSQQVDSSGFSNVHVEKRLAGIINLISAVKPVN